MSCELSLAIKNFCLQYLSIRLIAKSDVLTKMYVNTAVFNPLNAELNPICHLLTLSGAHPIFHVSSRIRVKDASV
jgi:hypothetical protein